VAKFMYPVLYGSGGFHTGFALVAGLAAGALLGRSLRVLRTPST